MDIFLFVLGYIIQCCAACLLMFKIWKSRSIYGLSVDTQICFMVANIVRCVWTLDTRLVETNFAYLELISSCLASVGCCYMCYTYYHTTTMHALSYLKWYVLSAVALVLAFFFHPSDQWIDIQILVAFTMYIEALGLLPQLWLMRKMYDVEPLTSHYVGLLIIARGCRMIFWGVLFWMGEHFLQLFLADILHSVFAADYMYLWCKKLKSGGRLIYTI